MRENFEIRPRLPERESQDEHGSETFGSQESQDWNDACGDEGIHPQSFEEFVNRKNLRIGEANFAPDLSITEPMFRRDCLRDLQALYSTSAPHSKRFPT